MPKLRSLLPALALAAFSTAFALYAAELVLALTKRPEGQGPRAALYRGAAERRGVPFDERTRLEVLQADRTADPRVMLHFLPAEARKKSATFRERLLPLASHSRARVVYCNHDGPWLRFETDAHGFRNPPGAWREPEVVAIGDSYTEGLCLSEGEHVIDRLRAQGFATLNLGVSGAGPLSELGAQREYLPGVRPRVVLWIYFEGNDLVELESEREHAILRRYRGPFTQGLATRQTEIDAAIAEYLAGAERTEAARSAPPSLGSRLRSFATLKTLRDLVAARLPREPAKPAPCCDLALFGELLASARDLARAQGAQLAFVYLPAGVALANPDAPPVKQIAAYREVLALAEAHELPIVDVRAVFAADADPMRFYPFPDGHFNAAGAEVAARVIAEKLRELDRTTR